MALRKNIFTGEYEEYEQQGHLVWDSTANEWKPKEATLAPTSATDAIGGGHNKVWSTPWRSKAMGAQNPDQIPEINEAMRAQGVGAYIDPRTNELVCESRGQRNRALQFFNRVDMDGGYGDVTTHSRPII